MIGVLEYAPVFSSDVHPVQAYLKQARRFLAPGGKLVLAIENKLGLKYFHGRTEDHVGQPYYGLQGLYGDRQPITLGRRELKKSLANAGFSATRFYYPFPDYKLPETILADVALSCPELNACDWLPWQASRDYVADCTDAFSEPLVLRELLANGLLADLAHSFLIVAGCDPVAVHDDSSEMLWRFAVDRTPRYATQTVCREENGKLLAEVSPLAVDAGPRNVRIREYDIALRLGSLPMDDTLPCAADFLRMRLRTGSSVSSAPMLTPWFRKLLENARAGMIDGSAFDLTPFGMCEWTSRTPVSLAWALTRSLRQLLDTFRLPCTSADIFDMIEVLYRAEGLPCLLDVADVDSGLDLENEFQRRMRERTL
jgi:hypothetical protein